MKKRSWKTSTGAAIALAVLLLNAAASLLDDNPQTNPDFDAIGIAALAVGTMFARDNDVTSQDVGARPE